MSGAVSLPPLPREVPGLEAEPPRIREHATDLRERRAALVGEREQLVALIGGLRDRVGAATADETPLIQAASDDCAARVATFEVDLDRWITDLMAEAESMQDASDGPADAALDSMPGPGAPAREVRRWWAALTHEQQLAIVAASPGSIGNRDGVPPWARDAANTVALARDLADWGDREDRGLLGDDERRWLANARAAQDALAAIGRGIDPQTLHGVASQLYLYDPTAFDGDGAVAVAAGDLATAHDVAVTVAGVGADARSAPFQAGRALDLYEATRSVDGTGGVATLCWIGRDGERLADLLDGLRDSHDGDQAHATVIGCSEHSTYFDHGGESLHDLGRTVCDDTANRERH